jgi:MFS family permease
MGFLAAAETLPGLIAGPFAGVFVDRRRRRPVLTGANVARALLLGLVPLAAAVGFRRLTLLYVIACLVGVAAVCFDTAHYAYLPWLAGRPRLLEANSRLQLSQSLAQVAGPSLGGTLVQLLNPMTALALDAGAFLLSALAIRMVPLDQPAPAARAPGRLEREIIAGLSAVFSHPALRLTAASLALFNLFAMMVSSQYVLYTVRTLGVTPPASSLRSTIRL